MAWLGAALGDLSTKKAKKFAEQRLLRALVRAD